jgi:hypothetical protein
MPKTSVIVGGLSAVSSSRKDVSGTTWWNAPPATPPFAVFGAFVRRNPTRKGTRASRRNISGKQATTKRWRQEVRPRILRRAVAETASLPWSPALLELLLDELSAYEGLEELLGSHVRRFQKRQYPQAIAMALLLRHSWLADDLAWMLERLCELARRTGRFPQLVDSRSGVNRSVSPLFRLTTLIWRIRQGCVTRSRRRAGRVRSVRPR